MDEPILDDGDELGLDMELLSAWEAPEPSDDFVDRVMLAHKNANAPAPEPKTTRSGAFWKITAPLWWTAAGVAMALMVSYLWSDTQTPAAPPQITIVAPDTPIELAKVNVGAEIMPGLVVMGAFDAWSQTEDGTVWVRQTSGTALYTLDQPRAVVVDTPSGAAHMTSQLFRVTISPSHVMCDGPNDPPTLSATELTVYEGQGKLVGPKTSLDLAGAGSKGVISNDPAVLRVRATDPSPIFLQNLDTSLE